MHILARPVATSAERAAAYAVRRLVFQDEQHVPAELEFDDDDETALLYVALAGDQIIGTGRLITDADHAKLGRMAVLREWRQSGAGRVLMDVMMAEAARRGISHLILHAQVQAIGFYQRCGFTITSDEFEQAGIPHRRMEREINLPSGTITKSRK